ncbi:phosphatidylinositol-3-phosphatase SAC1 isoform X2 [Centruroides vittatus]|uniref:phosphatidylinositol-3-phosphatase SAC1 isoform X2 n=1 Tax=Centruroides vittatus TaxID=120091 RepID=UPI00350FA12E
MSTVNSSSSVYENLMLYITPDKFYLEPLESPDELIIIDRLTKDISLQINQGQIPASATSKPICGIMGIIHLIAGPHLVLITKKSKVGEINGQSIWRVEDTEIHAYARASLHLTEDQNQYDKQYLSMIQSFLRTPYFYFSTSYDLSHTVQRLYNTSPDFLQMPLFERGDQRFIWNHHLMRDLLAQQELHRYWLPVIHGFICIKPCIINQHSFSWILISRRSCYRAGTRLFMRGVDTEGHVANYIETEQIVEYDGCKSSFVQTRGSIPLFWSQLPDLRYKPKPTLSTTNNQVDGYHRHFDSQLLTYNKQIIINLIDHKGIEEILETNFANAVREYNNPQVRYVSFDFHKECGHMRWERLSLLMERINQDQNEMGYILIFRDGTLLQQQEGVFRTNCIDCLDRTNVVQSMLAKRSLQSQLKRLGILTDGQRIESQSHFETMYKNVWADNADICSVQYAGTGALKTDYTRTGKRTVFGAMKDGLNSMIRYYKNNFADGFRQDSVDLFLGNYQVDENEGVSKICPLMEKKELKNIIYPVIILFALAMFVLSFFIPAGHPIATLVCMVFWAAMVVVVLTFVLVSRTEFVDYPKLRDLRPKIKHE